MKALESFKARTTEIAHLGNILGLLGWDMETHMPPKGADNRAAQQAALAKIYHERMTASELGELLASIEQSGEELSFYERGLVRYMRREYDQACKLPAALVQEMAETESKGHHAWVEAKKTSDFSKFSSILEKIVGQKRQVTEALGYVGSPYNALLNLYEPGLTTETLDPLFADLKKEIVPLVKAIGASSVKLSRDVVKGDFELEKQKQLARQLMQDMGFDLDTVRMDIVPHPMCGGNGPGDLGIGNRYFKDDVISGLYSLLHEGGHGLYDQGVDPEIASTPLAGGASLGIHESQSRMWENQVGRSKAFMPFLLGRLQSAFPGQLDKLTSDALYKAVNVSQPSLIRVEADEVTYNLHIMLRYELEKDLIEGKLKVADVPRVWNQKMQDYFGITPPNDAQGCLQDVHWSMGGLGYFSTYTLGNLYAAQFFNKAKQDMPDLEAQISQGNLIPLKVWLNKNIHYSSKAELPEEIVRRVTGEPLNAKYFVEYLKAKYGELYSLTPTTTTVRTNP